jgi:hypothetical protein
MWSSTSLIIFWNNCMINCSYHYSLRNYFIKIVSRFLIFLKFDYGWCISVFWSWICLCWDSLRLLLFFIKICFFFINCAFFLFLHVSIKLMNFILFKYSFLILKNHFHLFLLGCARVFLIYLYFFILLRLLRLWI